MTIVSARVLISEAPDAARTLSPLLGFVVCLLLWLSLRWHAKLLGVIWMALGIAYSAYNTHGFQRHLINFDVPANETETLTAGNT